MAAGNGEIALLVESACKSFGGVQVVSSANLTVRHGERHALIGPNGAGKTTLFNVIAGELQPNSGRIHLLGKDITQTSVRHRALMGLGRTYQISQLFGGLTVRQNLMLAAADDRSAPFKFLSRWDRNKRAMGLVEETSERVWLMEALDEKVSELSHGMQRQLEIGMVLAMRPRLIMLDEPAAGLSPSERQTLATLIRELPKDSTLILIEHDMELVLKLADRLTVLNRGAVIAVGTPKEIRANEEVQRVYLGSASDA
jgi:branched-chain amino acid transport system ATP-binding protein